MTMAGPGAGAAPETVTSTSSAPAALTEDSRVNRLPADPKGEAIPAGDPIPSVSVRVSGQNGSTWTFGVTTDMTLTMATGPYEPLKGHLHVFVDGVEKQMIATKTFTLANLAPGSHVIQVAAAATDHRNLLHDGRMVGAGVEVQVPAGTR